MSRGGAGRGQGRKPVLPVLSRLYVGQRCEVLWCAEIERNENAEIAERTKIVEIEWAKARSIPVRDRKAWSKSYAGEQYLEDVEYALREQAGISSDDDAIAPRAFRLAARRPKGKRKSIIAQVAAEESVKRGIQITARLAEACWKAYRRFDKQSDEF